MDSVPNELYQQLKELGQEHLVRHWDELTDVERGQLVAQIAELDVSRAPALYRQKDQPVCVPTSDQIRPVPVRRIGNVESEMVAIGERAFASGEVAFLVVAGGHGTRLGASEPKGLFPIGPVSGNSLFQIHAEKVLAISRRYGKRVPLLVMTSRVTHEPSRCFFQDHHFFGMNPRDVHFFQQGEMPVLDAATGKILLESPGRIATSPNGHGGTLDALSRSGLLAQLQQGGIKHVYYFQVDNPLTKLSDAEFLGRHVSANAELSCKVVAKRDPLDKLGNFVLVDRRCAMIEYSDLPSDLAKEQDASGKLRIWAGNPAIHLFSVEFLMTLQRIELPFHVALKTVPFLNEAGQRIEPTRENALKFEKFIFDVMPRAERWQLVETVRDEEFVPLKNATGDDSPLAVQTAISNVVAAWAEKAGITVPRDKHGKAGVMLEVSPMFALDEVEFARKVKQGTRIDGPTYFSEQSNN